MIIRRYLFRYNEMKIKYACLLISLITISCSSKFSESNLMWKCSFEKGLSELIVTNDSILYSYSGAKCYLLDANTGLILKEVSQEKIVPFQKKFGEHKCDEIKGNKYITYIKTNNNNNNNNNYNNNYKYKIIWIDYSRIFRWQKYDKCELIITRNVDNKTLKIKFRTSEYCSIFQVIAVGVNRLIISYDTYDNSINKVGMIDLDKLF